MWHQLVLHGIGGHTVALAKEHMSNEEFLAWAEYIRRHGSLHWGARIDHGAAVVSLAVNRANGGKAQLADFLPQREPAANDDPLEVAMREWS